MSLISGLRGETVWPSGKAEELCWLVKTEGPRFDSASALLSLLKVWSVDIVLSRQCDFALHN